MRAWRIVLAALAAFCVAFTVGTVPASANPVGNIAQPNTSFNCYDTGIRMISGYIDVHFHHDANHYDDPYGTYWTINYLGGYVDDLGEIDTDIRYNGQTTWHYADTFIWTGVGTDGNLFINNMSNTANGGYARWVINYYVSDGAGNRIHKSCTVAPHGWSTGEQYGAP